MHRGRLPAGAAALAALSSLSLLSPTAHATDPGMVGAGSAGPGDARSAAAPRVPSAGELRTDAYLQTLRHDTPAAREFFRSLPKGADLHNHLSGAVSTEYLIELAGRDGLCIEKKSMTAVEGPCGKGQRPASDARSDAAFHRSLLRAWSMQDFPAGKSGHDHFFATFEKFGEVPWRHTGELLAEVADSAVAQNQFYLETMNTPASGSARRLADKVGWDADLDRLHDALQAGGGLDRLVAEARRDADKADTERRAAGRCATSEAAPGCKLPMRWISQVSRGSSPERVFTQMALGLRLAEKDPRFVAINLVQPEDGDSALRHYRLQMRMLDYLHQQYPKAHITLHAGELWPGLVKPEDLTFHINEAVHTGHAERIGHGVDLVHEDNWQDLARTMAQRHVAVEVPFTSNAQILGVSGEDHPFNAYRAHGVPIVLATDDPGISRTDISHEYRYAARTYDLSYPELKDLARASLEYAFLPGRSLWRERATADNYRRAARCQHDVPGEATPSRACAGLLDASPKAAVQWRQEAAFNRFENGHTYAG
ncbi:adenosine deaminase family protein [Streptomyces sp. NPDC059900]|uniref:adenosine deaminase family protein n=2 Tax=Streptomyces sp. NPDC059900 TaxID=3155816 RepID=UPI003D02DE62